ncbi:MAG: hypothetical protein WBV40_01485 [Candidatus Cybelea sp.]|jgi:hypothetical protein
MDERQYRELFDAILDLRNATELGFVAVHRRFDDVYHQLDGLDWRFNSLESRVEEGFRSVSVALTDIRARLTG